MPDIVFSSNCNTNIVRSSFDTLFAGESGYIHGRKREHDRPGETTG